MLIYSKSRKEDSFNQLLTYLNKEGEKERITILHNFRSRSDDLAGIEGEFRNNHQYCRERANGVVLYHEVLSFSEADRENVSEEILEDVGRRYIKSRAHNALVYAKVHLDRQHPHIHFVISGNLIESSKKLRLSKSRFLRIQRELEQYQLRKYPFLDKSIATRAEREKRGLEVKGKGRVREGQEQARRQGREVEDRTMFLDCLDAFDYGEYLDKLDKSGFTEYQRGNTPGIIDQATGQKYRLKSLGVLIQYQEAIRQWRTQAERLRDLTGDTERKILRQVRERGFRDRIGEVLNPEPGDRGRELREIRRRKRERSQERGWKL